MNGLPDGPDLITEHYRGPEWDGTAVFSQPRGFRYLLTREWGTEPPLVFIMLNPSTASAAANDKTISRCIGFARREGAGGLAVVNLFALRATNPRRLKAHHAPVGDRNDEFITACCQGRAVIAAWGANGGYQARDTAVLELLTDVRVRCLGTTKGGFPCHPLYLPLDTPLVPLGPAGA